MTKEQKLERELRDCMENKTKKFLAGMVAVFVAVVAGVIEYKNMH